MPVWLQTAFLLSLSNLFMTFAWYGHLKTLNSKPWIIAALVSWGIALFEYLLQVPANRIGYTVMSVGQLKIMQELVACARSRSFSSYSLASARAVRRPRWITEPTQRTVPESTVTGRRNFTLRSSEV